MTWINYLIRVPIGAILGTALIMWVTVSIIFLSVCVDWHKHIDELATLPADWLYMVKAIGGLDKK
jgi:hypothetical protein